MRRHGETQFIRHEMLGLLMNGGGFSPPPGAMHEGAVGGIHETDHRMIDMTRKDLTFDQLRDSLGHSRQFRNRGFLGPKENPNETVTFFDCEMTGIDFGKIDILAGHKGWNCRTAPRPVK